jgi:hypothetical protein
MEYIVFQHVVFFWILFCWPTRERKREEDVENPVASQPSFPIYPRAASQLQPTLLWSSHNFYGNFASTSRQTKGKDAMQEVQVGGEYKASSVGSIGFGQCLSCFPLWVHTAAFLERYSAACMPLVKKKNLGLSASCALSISESLDLQCLESWCFGGISSPQC